MPSALQTDLALEVGLVDHSMPLPKGNRHYQVVDEFEVSRHMGRLAADSQLVGILQYQRQ